MNEHVPIYDEDRVYFREEPIWNVRQKYDVAYCSAVLKQTMCLFASNSRMTSWPVLQVVEWTQVPNHGPHTDPFVAGPLHGISVQLKE
jgi:hypothetical protein